jgi:hypothetical protein
VTNIGLGHNELVAFLRWLGVDGDKVKEGRELHYKIKRVVFALDFDAAGANAFGKKRERLIAEFPGLEVVPVHDLLPDDVRRIIPPFDYNLFKAGGKYEGFKLDLNDLIKSHEEGWQDQNGISEDVGLAIEQIREKYRYKP